MTSIQIIERLHENSMKLFQERKRKLQDIQTKMAYLDRNYQGYRELKKEEIELEAELENSNIKTNLYLCLAEFLKKAENEGLDEALKKIDLVFAAN